jgi:transcriptional regulator of acetoin/glycerol metabolism
MQAEANQSPHKEWIRKVVQGEALSQPPEISDEVRRSWARCLEEYRLDPDGKRKTEALTRRELEDRRERMGALLEISKVEMNNLYQQVAATGYSIVLGDPEGVVLHQVGGPEITRTISEFGLSPGTVWAEHFEGTNGIGTCLAEGKSVIIHRAEHFFSCNTPLTCSGAPIFDPQGELTAVLDITGCSRLAQQHSQVLVQMASQMIENRGFLNAFRNQFMIRFHSRAEFVSTPGEGVVVFDEAGHCLAANRNGLFQLGYDSRERVVGRPIQEIFNVTIEELMDWAGKAFLQTRPLHEAVHNRRFFAVLQPPEGFLQGAGRNQTGCRHENARSAPQPDGEGNSALEFGDPQMARNIGLLRKVADRRIPILLLGETGTGKGVLAETFHRFSRRASKPFVPVCCAAIPETLIESELFGYRAGAFTGASREGRLGKVRQADGGTLFLDEIGDMPLSLQARLLRLLEEKEVVPLGSEDPVRVDVQVVSATNQDLREQVAQGRFREDLYYRLQGLEIQLPPFRERRDKEWLIRRLVEEENPDAEAVEPDPDLLAFFKHQAWPGNIRQLRNVLRSMLALRDSNRLTLADLPPGYRGQAGGGFADDAEESAPEGRGVLEQAEGEALYQVLEENHWNITATAQDLGCSRNTLYRKMNKLDIHRPHR